MDSGAVTAGSARLAQKRRPGNARRSFTSK